MGVKGQLSHRTKEHELDCVDISRLLPPHTVIPAKAGIQRVRQMRLFGGARGIDSRFRGNDGKCQHALDNP